MQPKIVPPPAYTDFQIGDLLQATLWNGTFTGVALEVRPLSLTLQMDNGEVWCIHRNALKRLDDGFQVLQH